MTEKQNNRLVDSLEVMAPAGNFECLSAALSSGADSVYFGVGNLNMRSHSANNFSADDLAEVCRRCHEGGAKAYLTLNICLYDDDLPAMRLTLEKAREAGVDAIIASDMSVILQARELGLEVHISTQLSISNLEALRFYARWADVVVLARELNLGQVAAICKSIRQENICGPSGRPVRVEMFVHGALCMAISGKCYLSLHEYGASANRGSCYQVCRRSYNVRDVETGAELEVDNKYIMSPKDLCTIEFLDKIVSAGVTVFKIEGRARSAEYVSRTVECYRSAADAVLAGNFSGALAGELKTKLAEVFNRGFWDGYYQGARLGEWSSVYGSNATRHKENLGRVTDWFAKLSVAEIKLESNSLSVGDEVMIIGATSGVNIFKVEQLHLDDGPAQMAPKGSLASIHVPVSDPSLHPRRGDRIYLWIRNS